MSADNGVYILKTINPKGGYEFRVEHLQAVDNVGWDDNLRRMTDDPIVQIHNAHEMWGHSHVWGTREDAFRIAEKILEDLDVCEYGIQTITIQAQWDQPYGQYSTHAQGLEEGRSSCKLPHSSLGYMIHCAKFTGFSDEFRRGFYEAIKEKYGEF
jgi:hypothetical protein